MASIIGDAAKKLAKKAWDAASIESKTVGHFGDTIQSLGEGSYARGMDGLQGLRRGARKATMRGHNG